MFNFFKFGKKKPVEVKPVEVKPVETKTVEVNQYVHKVGEMDLTTCITEAKSMQMDMRFINDKLSNMSSTDFIAWFQEYKKDYKKE